MALGVATSNAEPTRHYESNFIRHGAIGMPYHQKLVHKHDGISRCFIFLTPIRETARFQKAKKTKRLANAL